MKRKARKRERAMGVGLASISKLRGPTAKNEKFMSSNSWSGTGTGTGMWDVRCESSWMRYLSTRCWLYAGSTARCALRAVLFIVSDHKRRLCTVRTPGTSSRLCYTSIPAPARNTFSPFSSRIPSTARLNFAYSLRTSLYMLAKFTGNMPSYSPVRASVCDTCVSKTEQ